MALKKQQLLVSLLRHEGTLCPAGGPCARGFRVCPLRLCGARLKALCSHVVRCTDGACLYDECVKTTKLLNHVSWCCLRNRVCRLCDLTHLRRCDDALPSDTAFAWAHATFIPPVGQRPPGWRPPPYRPPPWRDAPTEQDAAPSAGSCSNNDDDTCIVCLDEERTVTTLCCKMPLLCVQCALALDKCPLCDVLNFV